LPPSQALSPPQSTLLKSKTNKVGPATTTSSTFLGRRGGDRIQDAHANRGGVLRGGGEAAVEVVRRPEHVPPEGRKLEAGRVLPQPAA
jgi:hypothetical protein